MPINRALEGIANEVPYWNEACCALKRADPTLGALIRSSRGSVIRPRSTPFHSLCRSIVGQQLSVHAAEAVWKRVVAHVGAITPCAMIAETKESLRQCGLSRPKAHYLVCLAEQFTNGALQHKPWHNMDDEEVIGELVQVKGIGRWTAEMFLIFFLTRPDVLPLTDIGIQRAIAKFFTQGERPTSDEIIEIADPWRPWRSVASWYLWRSLDAVPVHD